MTSSLQLYSQPLGLLTDLYQLTMAYGYWKLGHDQREAVFNLSFRKHPFDGGFTLACGLATAIDYVQRFAFIPEDLAYLNTLCGHDGQPLFEPGFCEYLRTLRLTCDLDAIPEGTVVFPHEPLIRVKGPLLQCQLLETALLNMINFPTLVATKAARICLAARGEPVLEFGLRRAQAMDGAVTASRAAYVGGCAATSNVLAGRLFGIPVKGTHAHSWVMCFENEPEAFAAYAQAMPNNVVLLVDTYDTLEGVRNAVEVGRQLQAQGRKLLGIRLDSGDLAYLSIEARKILDEAGFTDTAIVASNDLDEEIIGSLKDQGATIGVWGVGTRLVTAYDQPALGGVYKLAAIREAQAKGTEGWEHKIKLSEQLAKTSIPGILQVRRFQIGQEYRADMIFDELLPAPTNHGLMVDPMDDTRRRALPLHAQTEDLLVPIFRGGRLVYDPPTLESIRVRAQTQLAGFHPGIKRFVNPHQYPVGLEKGLFELRHQMMLDARVYRFDYLLFWRYAMKLLKVAAAVLNQTPLDWAGNLAHIRVAIAQAKDQGVSVLCLPELCITGYGCEDAFQAPGVQETAWQILHEILPETRGLIVSVGLPVFYQNAVFNTAALLVDGRIAGFVAKRFLAGDGIHYEPRWFKPWPQGVVETLTRDGQTYPIGDLHFDCGGVKVGFEICEDAWVAQRPGRSLALRGVDLILNPSASHFAFGKLETRKRFVMEGSRAFGVTYLYANLLGNESGRAIYDGGAFVASGGNLVANGRRFGFTDMELTSTVVDLDLTRMVQARTASFTPRIEVDHRACVAVPFIFPVCRLETQTTTTEAWEHSPDLKEEEFTRAEALALFDYLRKSRSKGFVVSLSGGVDSAAVSTLVATMVERGVAELGREGFQAKLAYMPELATAKTTADLIRALLTCVYQATENSSKTTRDAAQTVAEALGATFLEFNVDALAKQYVRMVGDALGRPLTWEHDDIALQNIQARTRAPGVWLLANLKGALLLATSNRSEAAVGYATMDGDTCGGLSPIAGIDKAFLRRWSKWMEHTGSAGLRPIPALTKVNQQAPTAELRPQAAGQTDEDDLMPYDLLDAIERAAIRDKRMPVEIFDLMAVQFPAHTRAQLALWIERFFRLWCRNQWKRERYAPSFHLDDENLDPKTWCRFPILSGGFERELAELRQWVERERV